MGDHEERNTGCLSLLRDYYVHPSYYRGIDEIVYLRYQIICGKPKLLMRIFELAMLIPSIAVGVRRMHDIGKSGWFLLIPIYNIVLCCRNGTSGDNKYGADPKQAKVAP